jgi:endonuclease-3
MQINAKPQAELQEKALQVLAILKTINPKPETELLYKNPYELLVAVVLSAQCTDKRVNTITPAFFHQFPTVWDLAKANAEEIFPYIRSISYPNNKAKNLAALAQKIIKEYNGVIPQTIEELVQLPGVGRKTASVVASVLYQVAAMPVDTHVFRVANRLGLTNAKNTRQSERQLLAIIPPTELHDAHHLLILHGRYTCKARKPKCEECSLKILCDYFLSNQQNPSSTS